MWTTTLVLLGLSACGPSGAGTTHIQAENALGPYSGSVQHADFCFVSGKIGEVDGTFEHEVQTAIDALEAELARAGLELSQVVSVTVYLTDMSQYAALNGIYETRFPAPYPARAVVEVAALPGDARLEIQAIARRREDR